MPERRGLGRGLEALIPTPTGLMDVQVDSIVSNPSQPRVALNEESLRELAESIRQSGLVQPIIVTRRDEGYQIVAGERRWRAAKMAGLATIPAVVREATPQEGLIMALVENLQREDLNPLEASSAYKELLDRYRLTQEEVAQRVGKSRAAVANTLRLLHLPEEAKSALLANEISEGHARALLRIKGPTEQKRALERMVKRGLSVRQAEELVRHYLEEPEPPKARSPQEKALEEEFMHALGTKVSLIKRGEGGRLIIYFYSDEELNGLYDRLVGG
jgi:ParB family chromosome partitioning protein